MRLIKVFFILLGGDYGLELASLEAFPAQAYGVDSRANLLFTLVAPFLLCRMCFSGGTVFLVVTGYGMCRIWENPSLVPRGKAAWYQLYAHASVTPAKHGAPHISV